MLRLAAPTRTSWLAEAAARPDLLLIDHAHCEKKAASMAVGFMFKYPQHAFLMRPLSELAREELEHFELVLGVLERRGIEFRRLKPSSYAGRLMQAVAPAEPDKLLDTLLCCALIEARSCERMQVLAEGLEDAELAELYGSLLASEARHHGLYLDLACQVADREAARARLEELAAHEAQVLETPDPEVRVHS